MNTTLSGIKADVKNIGGRVAPGQKLVEATLIDDRPAGAKGLKQATIEATKCGALAPLAFPAEGGSLARAGRMPMPRALLLAAAAVLLSTSSAFGQDWLITVFPDRSHDFGTVARGSRLRYSFRVVNTSRFDIHIADWRPKCGCTDVKVGARAIPPGTQTVVEAILDTSKFEGHKASGLTLILDRPQFVEVELNLTCFIRGDVFLHPGQVDFGVVKRGSKPTALLTLTYQGGVANWAVTRTESTNPLLAAQLREVDHSPGGSVQYQLAATLDPSTPPGYFKDEISLVTNDPSSPRIPVSVVANVQSAVSVSPSSLNFGAVRPGQVVVQRAFVRSSKSFRLSEMTSRNGDLKATGSGGDVRTLHTITLTFTAPGQPGPYHDVLEIATDVQGEAPVKLNVFATITP
jgi:hypothetical protein